MSQALGRYRLRRRQCAPLTVKVGLAPCQADFCKLAGTCSSTSHRRAALAYRLGDAAAAGSAPA